MKSCSYIRSRDLVLGIRAGTGFEFTGSGLAILRSSPSGLAKSSWALAIFNNAQ